MKIVDVNEFYAEQGGGVRTYVHAKLAAAAKLGHELVVIAPGRRDGETEREGGRIIWVKGPPMPFDPRYTILYNERAVHRIIERERPSVVEGSSPWTAGWFAARYRGPGAKALVYHQDPVAVYPQTFLDRWVSPKRIDEICFPYWQYVRELAKHFDATVVAGQWLAERLKTFGITRAEAVPFGIDRSLFTPDKEDASLREALLRECGMPKDAALLISISRYHPEKRITVLLDAFKQLSRERPAGLVVFGDGPFRAWIKRAAEQVPGVHLAGYVKDRELIARALASADTFVHGSAAETYGFVIAEAMCSGLPVVVPNRGGAFDLADPSYSETYTPGDAGECAEALSRLLARPRSELRAAAVDAGHNRVRSTEEHFEALFELYGRLAAAAG